VIHPSDSSLLSVCCDGLLFVFQFCRFVWLSVFLTGSGDELVDHYLPYFRQWLITCLLLALLPLQTFFTESSWRLTPCSSSLSCALS
jgi:hypothetical protein